MGFEAQCNNWVLGWSVQGQGKGVTIEAVAGLRKAPGWRFRGSQVKVSGEHLPAVHATASEEDIWSRLKGDGLVTGVLTGDEAFDTRVQLLGNPVDVLGAMSHAGRNAVESITQSRQGYLAPGVIGLHRANPIRNPINLTRDVSVLLRASDSLNQGGRSPAERLAHNATGDPDQEVRLANLRLLLSQFADSPETADCARAVLSIHGHLAQLEAARFLGHEGVPTLLGLVGAADAYTPARIAALEHLVLVVGGKDARQALVAGFQTDEHELLMSAAELVLQTRADVMQSAEPGLLTLLAESHQDGRVLAIEALGQVATPLAVEPLQPFTRGLFRTNRVKVAAELAVARIQERVLDGNYGSLSLVEPNESGHLSLAAGGELAMVPEPLEEFDPS